ncbi:MULTISPECIES: glycosyltransferase [Nostocales]|uniref:Glycosyl transferase n=3 Tax=Nostocales TaxID=1161 RepID=A0A0C1RBT2_9CYAN|nr:glycosyltransferase [Tolypothrix bouteillei]KAF3887969.1 glycosyltransferase [Tolypothrix bouteillei VB521301]
MIYFLTINYFSTPLVTKLISSLPDKNHFECKIIIINNSPDDNSIYDLKNESVLIFDATHNLGFGRACNMGLKWIYEQDSQGIVWIINPDAYLSDNPLEKVNLFFESNPEVSILGTIIHTPTGEIWFAGGCFTPATGTISTQDLLTNTETEYVTCDWVSGCSLIVNLRKFDNFPQFDPTYFLYYEDFDLCKRYGLQGHTVAVTKRFGVVHQPSSITNKYIFRKIKHSTYSYLITLEKYTNNFILLLRLIRLLAYTIVLMFVKPQVAFGKFSGVLMYLRRSLS